MAGGLTELGNLGQCLEGALRAFFQIGDGLLTQVVVESLLLSAQFHTHRYLCLLRQLVQHIVFRTAQEEGGEYLAQQLLAGHVVVALYGQDKAVGKLLITAQKSGIGKLEEIPYLTEMVLKRGAGQKQAEVALKGHGVLGGLGVAVLDGVRFVEHDGGPCAAAQQFTLGHQQSVGGEHHIAGSCLVHYLLSGCAGLVEQAQF